MTAQSPEPGAEAPGAPASVGSREVGAGGPAPGATPSSPELEVQPIEQAQEQQEQLEELKEQLREELKEKCSWIAARLNSIEKHMYPGSVYNSYVYYGLLEYNDYAFREPFDEKNVRSIRRVIRACEKANDTKLAKYVPRFRGIINELLSSDNEELVELGKRLKKMTFAEFLDEAEEIIDKLNELEYNETYLLYDYADVASMLMDVLATEIIRMARKSGLSKREAERIVECLVEC